MNEEDVRKSFNYFLKMYFDAAKEVYDEMRFNELPGSNFKYLKKIYKAKKITPSDFAKQFNLSKPTVTEIINKFLEFGLIVKKTDELDKRKYYISLTERGSILARSNEFESKRAVQKMYEKLTTEELKQLVSIFNKFEVKK
ncbi:hypothetical protein CI105_02820 [Candidatus Izimaplasma bacterium ZiA1]|uniref:MarR family winged helix-turn-helix transcriptional regulator n=1 Tax=Candidatus Izimoplasma sp. ZiA1 TaxID=2024899 RepID=UPI000BAA84B1|nr:hypothetical protein CI105_02820 [Candidatus Izimaplasma bacterium ZiA1]